ncbi:16S rRNA (uracil(1498)-N(3))-methyltransferase [Aureimonas phyllosphaerae]|uniref:Ribosomal RNA small subunit methyltransferase E n=1 Tax=Aureimonas phyllosphaerae TaxID=1166078 RepID=A0A7W6BTU2_9HYPH|nr:16S rRNA (uracil(1498)-N(3))-methyltransferase [Aureimonas phyllosphaerae]MBB3936802.1 16S rRNA (uracil1498-N3)-methyltransferase [Aureimonas phyllosphaerae]MBB3961083.1 16S rRNA (uracil1498-N3)-methyltransferase [Aureimonas phyllosphaerae]SFF26045.1 16S rRNA (uracil1498-N3)-methyltransferase [Aureimonas phyllosphaerae]
MPDYDFSGQRLFLDAPLAAGDAVEADAGQTNYLLNVLRLDDGAGVLVFNGRDGEWRARLKREGKKRLSLVPESRVREQTEAADLHYCFAPLKSARLDYMVQKAVEMGAGVLQPVLTQHCQAPRVNVERMAANAVEAAEQCGILSVPECREPLRFDRFLAERDAARALIFCDERADAASPLETLGALKGHPLALLIGPEGGFSAGERETLLALPNVHRISLGPRILRADTAAVAALAAIQASAGDWIAT